MMVSAGLNPPLVTCTLPSMTKTLSTSWSWQLRLTTEPLRIVAHAAGAGLVLAGGDALWMPRHERGADGAGFFEPGFGALGLHVADLKGVRMDVAFEARHGNAPLVAHSRIEGDAAGCRGNLLRGTHDDDGALVPVAHGLLVREAPARRVGRQAVDHVNRAGG